MNPRSADVLFAKGLAFESAGHLAEGIRCFSEVVKLGPSALAYWHLVRAQIAAAQLEEANRTCKDAIRLYPREAHFYLAWADIKSRLGHADAAREVLKNASESLPENASIVIEYARSLIHSGHFAEAIPVLKRTIALKPLPDFYRSLAKMRRLTGDAAGAERTVLAGRERFPLDAALANDCVEFDPAAAARSHEAMRSSLAAGEGEPAARSALFQYLTRVQATANRKALHRPGEGAVDWTDLVKWSDPEGLVEYIAALEFELTGEAPRAEAAVERACAAVAQMDWSCADRWFERARKGPTGTVADIATFDLDFYARLDKMTDEEIWRPFPPVSEVVARGETPRSMIFVSCDPKFYELFIERLLSSLEEHGADVGVHIHLLDGSSEEWNHLAGRLKKFVRSSVSMTAEASRARETFGIFARNYYHAARYVRFHQYLMRTGRPSWMLDVDLVVEANPEPVFKLLDGHDLAATSSAVSLEPWAKFRAGFVGVAPTHVGLRYLRLVSAYISYWYKAANLQWGIDQQALFGAYSYRQRQGDAPRTRFLGEEVMNTREGVASVIRPVTGAARWEKHR